MKVTADELARLRALINRASREDIPWYFSEYVRQITEALPALLDEIERLRGAVLRPLDMNEVVEALHAGHVERHIAEGDNAWATMQSKIDELRRALREACDGWRESYDAAGLGGDNNWPCGHDTIARLRKLVGDSR